MPLDFFFKFQGLLFNASGFFFKISRPPGQDFFNFFRNSPRPPREGFFNNFSRSLGEHFFNFFAILQGLQVRGFSRPGQGMVFSILFCASLLSLLFKVPGQDFF